MSNQRYQQALDALNAIHREDPKSESYQGQAEPAEWAYAQRMMVWLDKLIADAPETLKLAVNAQHLKRWALPRSDYPMDRPGYKKWRTDQGKAHAELAGQVMQQAGYDDEEVERTKSLIRKERFKTDPHAQALEDAACLVFLENYFAEFKNDYDDEKLIPIVQKTWNKMSEHGHELALQLPFDDASLAVVKKALA